MNKNILVTLLVSTVLLVSCKKKEAVASNPNDSLKGYWVYANGAEAYYDGSSANAKGTKVPTFNSGFQFVVGEDYWQDLVSTGVNTWTVNHIIRYSPGGTKVYSASTFTKTNDSTIQFNNSILGIELLKKRM